MVDIRNMARIEDVTVKGKLVTKQDCRQSPAREWPEVTGSGFQLETDPKRVSPRLSRGPAPDHSQPGKYRDAPIILE
jgi:hypothetical protein